MANYCKNQQNVVEATGAVAPVASRTASVLLVLHSLNLWRSTGGMNSLLPKDIPSLDVLMKVLFNKLLKSPIGVYSIIYIIFILIKAFSVLYGSICVHCDSIIQVFLFNSFNLSPACMYR